MSSTAFDFPHDLSPFPSVTQDILRLAHDLGWSMRWVGSNKNVVHITSPIEPSKRIVIPSTNLNADRARSTTRQIQRYSDPDKVSDWVDSHTTVRGKGAVRVALDIGPEPPKPTPQARPQTAMAAALTEADRSASRTEATIGDEVRSGVTCSSCLTGYDKCTDRILAGKSACCATCAETDTHDEKVERRLHLTSVTASPSDEVSQIRDSDRSVVTEKPWMARQGGSEGASGRMYESPSVIERVWSDGHTDYKCTVCSYTSDNPRSVSSHHARRKDGEHGQGPGTVKVLKVKDYTPTDIVRPVSAIRRLTSDLLRALDGMDDWSSMSPDELAKVLAEHVYEERPDREPAQPLTPEQILARITMLVDGGRLAEMHQSVERTAAALVEATEDRQRLTGEVADLQREVTRLHEERRALRDLLAEAGDS